MARKNLLAGLNDERLTGVNSAPTAALPPLASASTRGAIGAVSRSIEQIRSQAILELDPALIEPSLIIDRLVGTPEQHEALVASIREHGQQVPILVRPHPQREGRYQIAYGRRRLKALTELSQKVRAVVKPLTDEQLVVAQGQENSARTDLSFIEKALFAVRLEEGGYKREIIMAALSVEKTTLSRLVSSVVRIPRDLVEAIGPAPKAGRDRWTELATQFSSAGAEAKARAVVAAPSFAARSSDERFSAVLAAVLAKPAKQPRPRLLKAEDGTPLARVSEDAHTVTVAIEKKSASDFGRYLVDQLPELYAAFKIGGEIP